MTVSAVRWATVDTLHARTGLTPPNLYFGRLPGKVEELRLLIEIHYRHYQFYANMLVAVAIAYLGYRCHGGPACPGLADLALVTLEPIFYYTSRNTLRSRGHPRRRRAESDLVPGAGRVPEVDPPLAAPGRGPPHHTHPTSAAPVLRRPAAALQASLGDMSVVVVDGTKMKWVLPARNQPGRLYGGKLMVACLPAEGVAVALAADGEADDIRSAPALLPAVREVVTRPRLRVADRQFRDLIQPRLLVRPGRVGVHPLKVFVPRRVTEISQHAHARESPLTKSTRSCFRGQNRTSMSGSGLSGRNGEGQIFLLTWFRSRGSISLARLAALIAAANLIK